MNKSGQKINSLIVASNRHVRGVLQDLFICLGITDIQGVNSGEMGLKLLSDNSYELCIFDLDAGPMTAFEFVRNAREPRNARPFLPIVMVSAKAEESYIEDARDAGITEFLPKPITPHNFYLRVRDALERPRSFVCSPTYFGPDRRRAARQFELHRVHISRA